VGINRGGGLASATKRGGGEKDRDRTRNDSFPQSILDPTFIRFSPYNLFPSLSLSSALVSLPTRR